MPRRKVTVHDLDRHIGGRIRLRRTLLGMSQTALGNAIGLTFQQIQKYERGNNRVAASTLYVIAEVLDVPLSFFFDDFKQGADTPQRQDFDRSSAAIARLAMQAPEGVRKHVLGLLQSLAEDEAPAVDASDTAAA
ncbi:MAG TPA: helix-turn-helix transcriptional regulator [Alphaproteobacteria bacterium]|nr:helix-turn-helix transcriptional regulator [Alphaproteobacteria bacterium]